MNEEGEPRRTGYYLHRPARRQNRAVDYSLTAPHGWEFLLDNHLKQESDQRSACKHAVVLGEN